MLGDAYPALHNKRRESFVHAVVLTFYMNPVPHLTQLSKDIAFQLQRNAPIISSNLLHHAVYRPTTKRQDPARDRRRIRYTYATHVSQVIGPHQDRYWPRTHQTSPLHRHQSSCRGSQNYFRLRHVRVRQRQRPIRSIGCNEMVRLY
jgi:hypothetical protein